MDIFMTCDRKRLLAGVSHDDVIVIGGRMVVSGRPLFNPVWLELLARIKRYDSHARRLVELMRHDLSEKTAYLLKITDGIARGAFAGSGVDFKVGRRYADPVWVCGGERIEKD